MRPASLWCMLHNSQKMARLTVFVSMPWSPPSSRTPPPLPYQDIIRTTVHGYLSHFGPSSQYLHALDYVGLPGSPGEVIYSTSVKIGSGVNVGADPVHSLGDGWCLTSMMPVLVNDWGNICILAEIHASRTFKTTIGLRKTITIW